MRNTVKNFFVAWEKYGEVEIEHPQIFHIFFSNFLIKENKYSFDFKKNKSAQPEQFNITSFILGYKDHTLSDKSYIIK